MTANAPSDPSADTAAQCIHSLIDANGPAASPPPPPLFNSNDDENGNRVCCCCCGCCCGGGCLFISPIDSVKNEPSDMAAAHERGGTSKMSYGNGFLSFHSHKSLYTQ